MLITARSLLRSIVRPVLMLSLIVLPACGGGLPPLATQKQLIGKNELLLHQLTPQAFQETWGTPSYSHFERMQFFEMPDKSLVPHFRVSIGESPLGWDGDVASGMTLFLTYEDRGWLLAFLDDHLVYREHLPPDQVKALGRQWKREAGFRTRIELPPSSQSPSPH